MNERRYLYADLVTSDPQTHPAEPHVGAIGTKLNWLRAGVLGANDGIVSVAGIVVGVAAAIGLTLLVQMFAMANAVIISLPPVLLIVVGGGLVLIAVVSGALSLGILKNSQPADLLR